METQILLLANSGFTVIEAVFFGLIFVVFYFFFLRPQSKKAKEQRNFIDCIEKGDKVVTSAGIHGKVVKVEENTLSLLVDTKTHLTIDKTFINTELSQAVQAAGKAPKETKAKASETKAAKSKEKVSNN